MIRAAQTEDLAAVRDLFREYAALVGDAVCFESFEHEMASLPGLYAPPQGRLLLAMVGRQVAGCAALRQLSPGVGEMKRLYVRAEFRGNGTGRQLAERIIAEARAAEHLCLRLDTLPRMESAIRMYRSLGFLMIPPYADNPPGALCFELRLNSRSEPAAGKS